jgi:hypothetical protein
MTKGSLFFGRPKLSENQSFSGTRLVLDISGISFHHQSGRAKLAELLRHASKKRRVFSGEGLKSQGVGA